MFEAAASEVATAHEVAGEDELEPQDSREGTVYLGGRELFSATSNSRSSSVEALDVCEVCEVAEELW